MDKWALDPKWTRRDIDTNNHQLYREEARLDVMCIIEEQERIEKLREELNGSN